MNNMSKLTIGSAAGIFAVIAGGYALASLTTLSRKRQQQSSKRIERA